MRETLCGTTDPNTVQKGPGHVLVRDRDMSPHTTPARYKLSEQILAIALRCAARVGLVGDAAEDCALSFVARVLFDGDEDALRPPETRHLTGTLHAPRVTKAALRHSLKFHKRQRRIETLEIPWFAEVRTEGQLATNQDSIARDIEAILMKQVVLEAIQSGVMDLAESPREFVLLYHFGDLSFEQIAHTTGRTRNAIDQALLRARRHLGAYLARKGWSADDLRLHLAAAPGEADNTP